MIAALVFAATVAVPPAPQEYVTDNAHALSASAAQSISQELQSYYDATGNRIIVYVDRTTGDTPLEDWTVNAAEKWKLRGANDKGAVLFAFMQDHKVRIEVGYGLESSLTDADSSRIIRDTIVPRMRAGDVDGAIAGGVNGMLLTITPSFKNRTNAQATPAPETLNSSDAVAVLIIAVIAITLFMLFIGSLFSRRGRSMWYWGSGLGGGWYGGGGGGGFSGGGISGGFSGIGFGGGGASGSW